MIQLIEGDCLKVMPYISERSIDLILADPPYGITACKWDTIISFDKIWKQLHRLRKNGAPIVLFGNEPFSSLLRVSNINEFKYRWLWIKNQATNHLHAKRMPLRKTEDINVFFEKSSWYNPQKTTGHIPTNSAKGCSDGIIYYGVNKRNYQGGDTTRMPLDILYFNCVNNYARIHPNEKPIALMEYLIKTYTNEGNTVLDFTMGSGTTGLACKNLNRNFIGIEFDNKYFEIAKKRIGVNGLKESKKS